MPKFNDITGKTFNRLTVISCAARKPVRWNCRCICGGLVVVKTEWLASNNTKSCGCLNIETRKTALLRHGRTHTTEHVIWRGMRRRCENINCHAYKNYGGRGISVCERWQTFENFFADMGPRPSSLYSLDRVDNDGNYEPGNCRWATRIQQIRNRRSNKKHPSQVNGVQI